MKSNARGTLTRAVVFTLAVFLALPVVAFGQRGNGKGRGKPSDVFVNGHDARDGRTDGRGPRGDRGRRRDRRDDDDYYRRNRRDRDRRHDDRYNDGRYNDGRYNGGYGYDNGRQTALNAGYNEGIKEGRNDRNRGDRFDYRDEGDYQSATKDYSSRHGDRETYRRYFRQGFANGYRDGYNGH